MKRQHKRDTLFTLEIFDFYIKCLDAISVKPVRLPAQPCFKRRDTPAGPAPRRGLSTRMRRRLALKFKSTSGRRLAGRPQPGEAHLRPRPAARRAAQRPPTGRRGDARKLRSSRVIGNLNYQPAAPEVLVSKLDVQAAQPAAQPWLRTARRPHRTANNKNRLRRPRSQEPSQHSRRHKNSSNWLMTMMVSMALAISCAPPVAIGILRIAVAAPAPVEGGLWATVDSAFTCN